MMKLKKGIISKNFENKIHEIIILLFGTPFLNIISSLFINNLYARCNQKNSNYLEINMSSLMYIYIHIYISL